MPRGQPVTDAQREALLAALREGCTVVRAAARAKMAWSTAWQQRRDHPGFREAWDAAAAQGEEALVARLEAEADRRAEEGALEPIFHEGVQVGTRIRYSDTLLIFRLKALRPEKYRDRQDVKHTGPNGGPVVLTWGDGSS